MTVTEALLEGLKVTVVGLAIVFAVLIILMLVLMLMKVFFVREPKKDAAPQAIESTPAEAPAPVAVADDVDEDELIAVLTAAIAASLNTSTYNLQIKSYRRVGNSSPAWNQAGLRDTIDSRF